jgi:NADH dehydrogenase
MDVLVVGGTGFIGSHLCTELDGQGHEVTALSRDPEAADLPEGVETVAGDVTDYDSIADAFEGQDTAVNLVALSPLFKPDGGDERHFEVHLGGTENVARAADEHGLDRVVQMSALGADPEGPTAYIRSKGQAEAVVRDADTDAAVVRPSVVFGDGGEFVYFTRRLKRLFAPGLPVYPLPGGGKTRFQPLWVGDLVEMLDDCVAGEADGEAREVGGPEVLTLAEVAKLAFRAEGKSVSVVPVPMALAGAGLSVMGVVPGFPMGADQYRSLKFDNTVAENDVTAFGRDPAALRTLSDYLDI